MKIFLICCLPTSLIRNNEWEKATILGTREEVDTIETVAENLEETKREDLNFDGVISFKFNDECCTVARELLNRYSDCFANSSTKLRKSNIVF